jgi:hypothetical protein
MTAGSGFPTSSTNPPTLGTETPRETIQSHGGRRGHHLLDPIVVLDESRAIETSHTRLDHDRLPRTETRSDRAWYVEDFIANRTSVIVVGVGSET